MNNTMYLYRCRFPNGKSYIGITNNFYYRKHQHISDSKNRCNLPFHNALTKYKNKEQWEIIHRGDKDEIIMLEQFLIDMLNTRKPYGYNLTTGGEFCQHHYDTKQKIGNKNKGKRAWNKGVCFTEERKKLQSIKLKNRIPWNKGKTNIYSEETIIKMKTKAKEFYNTPEGKKIQAERNNGWTDNELTYLKELIKQYPNKCKRGYIISNLFKEKGFVRSPIAIQKKIIILKNNSIPIVS